MTTRMGDERSRSPLHVHVGQGTPVHVHLKAKASGSMMWQVGKEKKKPLQYFHYELFFN